MSTNYSDQWWDQIFTQSFGKHYTIARAAFDKFDYWYSKRKEEEKKHWKQVEVDGWYEKNGKKYVDAIDGTVEYDPTYSVIMEDEQGWRHVVRR